MPEPEFRSQLPSPKGSPFKTKNFSKFFFGIVIAALILVAIILAYFLHAFGRHTTAQPVSSIHVPAQHLQFHNQTRLS